MRRWLPAMTAAVVLTCGLIPAVRANPVAPPPPPPNVQFGAREAKVVVEVDERAKQPRLVVPAALLGPQPRPGAGAGFGQLPTVVAGVALTLAFVTGGFWLLRKGPGRALVLLFAVSLLLAGTAFVQADVPRDPPPKAVKLPADVRISQDKLTLEVVPFGDTVRLIVPKDGARGAAEEKKDEKKQEQ